MSTSAAAVATPPARFALLSLLSKDILTGPNYVDWVRSLRIALRYEKKEYVLDQPLPEGRLAANASAEVRANRQKHSDDSMEVSCLMLACMSAELQKTCDQMGAFEMANTLREMFQQQARQERYETVCGLLSCKMKETEPVSGHVLKLKGFIDRLERLGVTIPEELTIDMILYSLPSSYHQFIINYNMNGMTKTVMELHGLLKSTEGSMKHASVISSVSSPASPVLCYKRER